MQWLKDHMEITVTPAIPNASDFDKVINGNQITLESRYTVFNAAYPGFGDLVTYNGFLARGLPKSNSDFGNHQITLKVDGQTIDVAHVQDFFNSTDSTHPADADDCVYGSEFPPFIPNWYVYYNQIYACPGTYWLGPTHTVNFYPYPIYFGLGMEEPSNQPVFEIGDLSGPNQLILNAGTFNVKGILSYIQVCAHEVGHQVAFQRNNIYVSTRGIDGSEFPFLVSKDGDDVDDAWEQNHHLNSQSSNTTGYYDESVEPGDNELIADIQAISPVFASKLLWQQDWANTGIQYGLDTANPLPLLPSDYAFTFTANEPGLNSFLRDSDHHIKILNELKNEYPNLITGLDDLNRP